jgi:hypothetical protein
MSVFVRKLGKTTPEALALGAGFQGASIGAAASVSGFVVGLALTGCQRLCARCGVYTCC